MEPKGKLLLAQWLHYMILNKAIR